MVLMSRSMQKLEEVAEEISKFRKLFMCNSIVRCLGNWL